MPSRKDFHFRITAVTIGWVMGLATNISGVFWCMPGLTLRRAICFTLCAAAVATTAQAAGTADFTARAQRQYRSALDAWRNQPSSLTAAVAVAHAACEFAEIAARDDDRADIANRGINAARDAVRIDPNDAAAHYWLGMNLGELARTKSLGALRLVKEMADEFFKARDLDEKVDHAGPDRSLGLLYRDAPGWPTSIGNKSKAREYLQRAVSVSPDFPDNQLALLEAFEEWGDRPAFERQFKITEQVLNDARARFNGDAWEASWADWESRFQKMKSKAGQVGRATTQKGRR